MKFAAHMGRTSGRATPSLRRTPYAHQTNDHVNPAGFHLTEPRICSNKPGQFYRPRLPTLQL